jgi:hypothetical protein
MNPYHFPNARRILELPVYRCSEGQYYRELKAQYESAIQQHWKNGVPSNLNPVLLAKRKKEFEASVWLSTFSYAWEFNQVVAWIRLYVRPEHIGASLHIRKYTRTPRYFFSQPFVWDSNNFLDVWVSSEQSSIDIFDDLRKEICTSADHHKLFLKRKWYIDMRVFDFVGSHLNWVELTSTHNKVVK